jgi:hypothetical protein
VAFVGAEMKGRDQLKRQLSLKNCATMLQILKALPQLVSGLRDDVRQLMNEYAGTRGSVLPKRNLYWLRAPNPEGDIVVCTVCPRSASPTDSSDLSGLFFVVFSEFGVCEKHDSGNVDNDVVRRDLRSSNISN